jgi:CBS domain-containing protein
MPNFNNGALSARDLLRQRDDDAIALGDDIDEAQNAEAMAEVWSQITLVASGLMNEEVDARDIAAVISRELCALTRQACKLAEAEMLEQGLGPTPCAYAMLVLGSGGRGESMLAMDQDNAIVYANGEPDGEEDQWFARLGSRVSDILDTAGVPYCKGNIMASNADWRHSLEHWQETVKTWISRQTPDDILNCDIFFDSVCVHGDVELARQTIDFAFELGSQSSAFLKLMSVNACKDRVPIGLFGRYKLEDGRMDLKKGGIMPIFSCARVLAIKHRIAKHSTPDRLHAAQQLQDKMDTVFENLNEAHRIIFNIILQQQLLDIEAGISPSNFIAPASLSGSMRKQLKWALERVPGVSNLLGDPLSSI